MSNLGIRIKCGNLIEKIRHQRNKNENNHHDEIHQIRHGEYNQVGKPGSFRIIHKPTNSTSHT